MLSHVLVHAWHETWTTVLLKGKCSTEIDGVCVIQVFIAWEGSASSIEAILDDVNTSAGWGLHDLYEPRTHIHVICIYIYIC